MKEQQDLAWSVLPKEARDEMRKLHAKYRDAEDNGTRFAMGYVTALNTFFGHHNLTSDEEPEEILCVSAKEVREYYARYKSFVSTDNIALGICQAMVYLFGKDKCLPDPSEEKPNPYKQKNNMKTPKLKPIADKIAVYLATKEEDIEFRTLLHENGYIWQANNYLIDQSNWIADDESSKIHFIYPNKTVTYSGDLNTAFISFAEFKEKYTEPEPQQTEERTEERNEENKERNEENKETMEEKELNLAELLKDAIGEDIYSPTFGVVKVTMANCNCIGVDPWNHNSKSFQPNGKYVDKADADISLYPSRDLYLKYPLEAAKAWHEWAEERKPKRWYPEMGEKFWFLDVDINPNSGTCCIPKSKWEGAFNIFRTEELCQQAAEAVRRTLEEFHEKNAEK